MSKRFLLTALLAILAPFDAGWAYQLAPLGSAFEEKLTKEPVSNRARVAEALGRLLKAPVHEEITQLAFSCPYGDQGLAGDLGCAGADRPFANAFVIYGVRWNDLPPFSLYDGEGRQCTKLLNPQPACKTSETVRFSTQPDCWYCLFEDAAKTAKLKRIAQCQNGPGFAKGNLMTRSHFGDLQFLHAMADTDGVPPDETRQTIMEWIEFAWKVATGEIAPNTQLKKISIPAIQYHFGCSDWTVADLYIQGRQNSYLPHIREVALGSVLHTVQDSFAEGHVDREPAPLGHLCSTDLPVTRPGAIAEFHSYAKQNSSKHDRRDSRQAMIGTDNTGVPQAVEASSRVVSYFSPDAAKWDQVKPYFSCLFDLSQAARSSSPGEQFRP